MLTTLKNSGDVLTPDDLNIRKGDSAEMLMAKTIAAMSAAPNLSAAAGSVASAATVDLDEIPGIVGSMTADTGVAEVVEIDFSVIVDAGAELLGKGILIEQENGDRVCYWFKVDSVGSAPAEGNTQVEIDIDNGDGPSSWASAAAGVINGHAEFIATADGTVVTVTAAWKGDVLLVQDGIAPTGLDIDFVTEGADPVLTVGAVTLTNGWIRVVRFAAGITLSISNQPGGADIITDDGDWGLFAATADGASLAFFWPADAVPGA